MGRGQPPPKEEKNYGKTQLPLPQTFNPLSTGGILEIFLSDPLKQLLLSASLGESISGLANIPNIEIMRTQVAQHLTPCFTLV